MPKTCPACNGFGTEYGETCVSCGGHGEINEDGTYVEVIS